MACRVLPVHGMKPCLVPACAGPGRHPGPWWIAIALFVACGDDADPADSDRPDGAAVLDAGVDAGQWSIEDGICVTPLSCDRGQSCTEYRAQGSSCTQVGNGSGIIAEGVCGAYQFRFRGGTLSSKTEYWNRRSGELVARALQSDTLEYCDQRAMVLIEGDPAVHDECAQTVSRARAAACDEDGDAGTTDDDAGT